MKCYNATFKMISGYGEIYGLINIKVEIFKKAKRVRVFVLDNPDLDFEFLIGLDLIRSFSLGQDPDLKVFQRLSNNKIYYKECRQESIVLPTINLLHYQAKLDHLEGRNKQIISNLINNHTDSFAKDKFDVGKVKDHEANIKLSEHRYVSRKPYRCNLIDEKEIESQISKLYGADLIEESISPFAAPVTLVYKK